MTDHGGPAFPELARWGRDGSPEPALQYKGMTLRDYFAAKAMQGMMSYGIGLEFEYKEIADRAYAIADAMLTAREKNHD